MFRQKIDILIFVEHRGRELETAALLKVLFEKNGYSVAVESVQFNRELSMIKYYPRLVIVPWVYGNREARIWSFLNLGRKKDPIVLLNMHQEQLTNEESLISLLPKGMAKDTYHLCWGDQFAKQLLDCGCKEDTLIKTGNIRLDFYKKRLRSLSPSKIELFEKYGISTDKKVVLFIANAFHLFTDNEVEQIEARGVDMEEQRKKSIISRENYLKYIDIYLREHRDTVFIYRPHPCHDSRELLRDDIQTLLSCYPKYFYCISDGPIRDWILNSDLCVTFHSTSAIECDMAEVPFYLMRSEPLSDKSDYVFLRDYPFVISDYDSFISAINNPVINYSEFEGKLKNELYIQKGSLCASSLLFEIKTRFDKGLNTYKVFPSLATIVNSFCRMVAKQLIYIFGKIPFIRKYIVTHNNGKTFNPLRIGADYWNQDDLNKLCERIQSTLDHSEKV